MVKELSISPRSLVKNIPSESQGWKLPVKLWIRDLYDKMLKRREAKPARKAASSGAAPQAASQHSALGKKTKRPVYHLPRKSPFAPRKGAPFRGAKGDTSFPTLPGEAG